MAQNEKHSKKKLLAYSAIILIVVIVAAVASFSFFKAIKGSTLKMNETWAVTTHFSNGTVTTFYNTWPQTISLGPEFQWGHQITIKGSINWAPGGNITLNIITCSTPGFTVEQVSPALPMLVSDEPQGVAATVPLTVTFNTPAARYVGDLNCTCNFTYYP
jgi:hypothetical protein